jgi:hypothetical protein
MSLSDRLFGDLCRIHELLDRNGVWHVLAYGTLLGAVRDGDLIPWDEDLDMLVEPRDERALLALRPAFAKLDLRLVAARSPTTWLPVPPAAAKTFSPRVVRALRGRRTVCDFFLFDLFADGVRRRYDFAREVYWAPHMSFPDYFMLRPSTVRVRDRKLPGLRDPEAWLASVYGNDWQTPRRNRALGGRPQAHRNIYGHRIAPRLAEDAEWCSARGWDRRRYAERPAWPREVRGAGPFGPTPRTERTSKSLWWRDLDELVRHF